MSTSLSFKISTSWNGILNQALQIKSDDAFVSSKSETRNEHISYIFEKTCPKEMFSRVSSDSSCLVCLDVIGLSDAIVIHPCSHYLHNRCHQAWLSFATSLKCEYCQRPTSSDFLLKIDEKPIDLPWNLIQFNQSIMKGLFSFVTNFPRLDPQMQILILETVKIAEYLVQKSKEAERCDFSSIRNLINECAQDFDAKLATMPRILSDSMIDKLSTLVANTLGAKWSSIKKDCYSFILLPISAASFVQDSKKMYFIVTLFQQLMMLDSSRPALKNVIQKFDEQVDLKVYQSCYKKLQALSGFEFFKTLQTMQEEEYLLLKKHAKGEGETDRKIQFIIKLNESLKTASVVFYLSLFAYFVLSSFLDIKKTNLS